jgi:predicted nucleic acid-binding protein
MNLVDSSAWLEYFANGANASFFAPAIERTEELLVPSLVLYEVFKRVLQQRDEGHALQAVAVMQQGTVVDLDARLALVAARISLERKLPMADSIILATARAYEATVWTQGADFKGLPHVQFRRRKP